MGQGRVRRVQVVVIGVWIVGWIVGVIEERVDPHGGHNGVWRRVARGAGVMVPASSVPAGSSGAPSSETAAVRSGNAGESG